ncbi:MULTISPECIES: type I glyceraldehyde-3-phosphate dehydrogenase [Acetobacteraceae]|uniref:Glyceraldehyde-3-phosphate dehydrogenase n=1 Tax=Parasaccharibacter apium TaxID=1510841 RepID=A0ABX4ZL51_9PROT|nr:MULTISPECIES: type I glyceraldehyde-3-phosphate dehydrogenase [Acetobacteraceae]MCQ0040956.1 type I glyceraldehyde-3-phosphate dehydrogenase [Bombella sp.]MUG79977.1 type I glyceraldehyde-3-phosphate dehydrogenase [Bombella sp. ESL0380]MCL1513738.1 type I glyceraldehyde-3-phosphate dehydrogenase [Parasaccharibacter sp. TMW 2.1891]MCL1515534.1 type I glyceraldehyde-3-phosphate dehydrogenase [Parasaccharibacter sp. TMW2.1890]MPV99671.1 type I glyceraldehyde-3-phosphate dehydrogenase [Bombella
MAVKIAINGFGRIGRLVLRGIIESGRTDVEPVLINDLGSVEANAHLLKYDTVHGRLPAEVEVVNGDLLIKTHQGRTIGPIKVTAQRNPEEIPLQGVDVAMECTGLFTARDKASALLKAGAKHVLVSAPGKDADATIVYGVNNDALKPGMQIVSNASCTTNCLSPVASVLDEKFGIERGYMVTVHSYTGDQRTIDTLHKDPRRARAAAVNIIPTSTGAARAVGLVLPQLKGKLDGTAIRVPTPNVSLVSLDFVPKRKPSSVEEVNEAIREASEGRLKGILGYNTEPLVSHDFNHVPFSSTFDATQTALVDGGELVRICAWYDNEWGFSNRMSDTASLFGKL